MIFTVVLVTKAVMSSEKIRYAHKTQTRCAFRFTPSELSRVGDVIGHVTAVDADEDSQSDVFYEIASGNEKGVQ